jgi:hypothetical protein
MAIGTWRSDAKVWPLAAGPPTTLVWDGVEQAVLLVMRAWPSGYRKTDGKDTTDPKGDRDETASELCPAMFRHKHVMFSSAPLEAVRSAVVFTRPGMGCRGILFEYEGGAQRAVGECRVGVDDSKATTSPSCLCILVNEHLVDVVFAKGDHQHQREGWECHVMSGILEFWFTGEAVDLEFKVS